MTLLKQEFCCTKGRLVRLTIYPCEFSESVVVTSDVKNEGNEKFVLKRHVLAFVWWSHYFFIVPTVSKSAKLKIKKRPKLPRQVVRLRTDGLWYPKTTLQNPTIQNEQCTHRDSYPRLNTLIFLSLINTDKSADIFSETYN